MAYNGVRFGQGINVFPVQPPKDVGTLTTETLDVDIRDANWVTFLVNFGNITSDASDTCTITVEATTDMATTGAEVGGWWYRKSSATATNTWGAITAGTSDGITITGADDNKSVLIDVDPAAVQAAEAGAIGVYLNFVVTGPPICLMSSTAFVEKRYLANTMSSS